MIASDEPAHARAVPTLVPTPEQKKPLISRGVRSQVRPSEKALETAPFSLPRFACGSHERVACKAFAKHGPRSDAPGKLTLWQSAIRSAILRVSCCRFRTRSRSTCS